MNFTKTSSKYDPVITYTSECGFYKITKKPNQAKWQVKKISLTSLLGEIIGEYDSLEEAESQF